MTVREELTRMLLERLYRMGLESVVPGGLVPCDSEGRRPDDPDYRSNSPRYKSLRLNTPMFVEQDARALQRALVQLERRSGVTLDTAREQIKAVEDRAWEVQAAAFEARMSSE